MEAPLVRPKRFDKRKEQISFINIFHQNPNIKWGPHVSEMQVGEREGEDKSSKLLWETTLKQSRG
jgi:hypothetical protein